jgi:selenocysteine lyase/cysteine desulfurase
MQIADVQALWEPAGVYCNTASYGLPPRPGWDALQTALADWHGGRTSWERWGDATDAARASFARLLGVDRDRVSAGSTVSELFGSAITALPDGARVVVPEVEFTSVLFPLLIQERLQVTTVPASGLADAIAGGVDAVAFSAVQMSSGDVADLDAIEAAAADVGAITLCDATQAAGWLPIRAERFDLLVCAAYKWLMSPRGSAFMTLSDRLLDRAVPHSANWFAGEDVHSSYFGPPLRLAASARRFDLSPAWFSWVGTLPALELIEEIGVDAIHRHDLALANRFRAGLGLAPGDSAIVSVAISDAAERLERAGIVAAIRGGRLRASWHVYNTNDDVDRVLDVLTG